MHRRRVLSGVHMIMNKATDDERKRPAQMDETDAQPIVAREKKRRKKDMTEEERLEERRAANRRSAFESRHRRKVRCKFIH